MRKKINWILKVATLVVIHSNETIVAPINLAETAFGRTLETGGRFCVGVFGENLDSVAVKLFSHLIYFGKNIYKCSFNKIFKDHAGRTVLMINQNKVHSRQLRRVMLLYFIYK
jgi:hypothetical protein